MIRDKRIKYREDMSAKEVDELLAQCERLEDAYAQAWQFDDLDDERSYGYFNRYIAGDR